MFYQQYFFQVYLCFLVHLLLRLNLTKIIIFLYQKLDFNLILHQIRNILLKINYLITFYTSTNPPLNLH